MTEIYRWRDPKPIFENLDNKRAEKPTGRWLERSWVLGLGGPIPPSPVPFPSPSDPSRLWTWARPFPKFRGGLGCLGLEGVRNASTHATSPVSTQGWRVVCRHWVPLIPQVVGPACLDPSYRVREGAGARLGPWGRGAPPKVSRTGPVGVTSPRTPEGGWSDPGGRDISPWT